MSKNNAAKTRTPKAMHRRPPAGERHEPTDRFARRGKQRFLHRAEIKRPEHRIKRRVRPVARKPSRKQPPVRGLNTKNRSNAEATARR